ncbi:VWA domain-containing protein [Streptomyces sp. NPDC048479]|uniref:VWA domain-containing protein n=1 Tax=Streptomyces sp. NPDC048479 TaxID=3154725 RepID=UPI003415F03B
MQTFLGVLELLGSELRSDVYWAGRLTLCGSQDDLERYDRVFAAYFAQQPQPGDRARRVPEPTPLLRLVAAEAAMSAEGEEDGAALPAAALASSAEVLRHRDMAGLSAPERAQLRRLLAAFSLSGEPRRTPRLRPARRGGVDPRRTARELLRRGGEPARLRHRAPATKPRPTVLLLDVSGSMAPYADALLRFAHAATHGPQSRTQAEVFTIGTAQMRRLRRLAHRVVWANPLKARQGYAPLAAGMAAALPSVDAFVEGHSLGALERLAAVVRGACDA